MKKWITSANPYMPLWEHVPDGEPRVFEHDGEKRVYVYGSHDTLVTEYCGLDYVVWSAPVDDLTDWKCHGTCYRSMSGNPLYAPDVVHKDGTYYMYVAEDRGSRVYVARSDVPWGPFTDPVLTDLGFDPGILVDDDGRVYAYWGFCGSYAAELDDDMATIKEGTLVSHLVGHANAPWTEDQDHYDEKDAFFEASSPRKVNGRYVLVYSRRYAHEIPELGAYDGCNGFLSYKYSDSPLGGFVEGGDVSFNGGEIIPDAAAGGEIDSSGHVSGRGIMTYQWGNNHGSIMQVGDDWYVFYHRQTGANEYSRQAMLERIEVAEDADGRLYIGAIDREDGRPVGSRPVEMTSQGGHLDGLDAKCVIPAGYACHLYDGAGKSMYSVSSPDGAAGAAADAGDDDGQKKSAERMKVVPVYTPESGLDPDVFEMMRTEGRVGKAASDGEIRYTIGIAHEDAGVHSSPVINVRNGSTIGFRYLQFGTDGADEVTAWYGAHVGYAGLGKVINDQAPQEVPGLTVLVRADGHDGEIVGCIGRSGEPCRLAQRLTGKRAIYFEFQSDDPERTFWFDRFTFD